MAFLSINKSQNTCFIITQPLLIFCCCTTAIFSPLIHSAESSVGLGFCQREESTEHVATLELSVCMKSRTHFTDTLLRHMKSRTHFADTTSPVNEAGSTKFVTKPTHLKYV